MVSHESVTALLRLTWLGPGPLKPALSRAVADWLNRRTARAYHRVICTTGWAAAEFGRIDAGNVVRVPLGVDLDTFSPGLGRSGPGTSARARSCWCTAAGSRRRRGRSAR
jgi:alpha-1,6-mannosyltransferase